jgi:NADH dehydrogenase
VIPGRTLVTGANGRLGRRLLRRLASLGGGVPRALVRSRFAADALADLAPAPPIEVWTADYANAQALGDAMSGCARIAHLAGILKETARSRYVDAHERATRALADAAAQSGVRRIVYLSILGASPGSRNACLASKGRAERILLEGKVPSTVLRVPMVLGPGELAAEALRAQASAPFTFLVRGGASCEQPLDADDLMRAVLNALDDASDTHHAFDLAGPESLPHAELVARAAQLIGKSPRIVAIPYRLASLLSALVERLPEPPITRAMLGVLEHDDRIDPAPACRALGIELTPLAETLRRSLEAPRGR